MGLLNESCSGTAKNANLVDKDLQEKSQESPTISPNTFEQRRVKAASIPAGRGGAEMGNSLCGLDQDPHVNMRSARAVKKAPLFALLAIIVCISCIWCNGFIFTHVQIYARLPKSEPHATRATGVTASDDQYPPIGAIDQLQAKETKPCNAYVSNVPAKTKQVPPLIPDDIATLRTAVALVFDRTYMEASVDMAKSLRRDGGWEGDILMVFDGDRAEIANHLATLQFGLNRTTIFHPDDLLPQEARDSPMFNSSQVAKCRGETKVLRAKYLKASTIFTTIVKERWHRILYVDSCHTIFTPDVDYFFTRINSKGILFVAPDPWRWAKEGLSSKLNTRCDKVAYNKLKADPLGSNSGN